MPRAIIGLTHSLKPEAEAPYPFMDRCLSPVPWVELWLIHCVAQTPHITGDALSNEEIARASAYRSSADAQAFIRRRSALRALIGRRLNCKPDAVRFSSNAYGKPLLAWPATSEIFSFSVAHTAGVALVAIAQCESVGVDIERVRHDIDFQSVARVVFAESELAWMTAGDRNAMADRFFRLWTRKEAYLKALGWGFLRDPRMFVPLAICDEAQDDMGQSAGRWIPKSGDPFELTLGKALRGAFAIG